MADEATPRPWKLGLQGDLGWYIDEAQQPSKCQLALAFNEADAELIIRAVNCHDELVAALEDLLLHCDQWLAEEGDVAGTAVAMVEAQAVLAKAKGGQ